MKHWHEILEAVFSAKGPSTISTLSRELGIPKTTVHRIVHTLVGAGWLNFSAFADGELQLGRKLRRVALQALREDVDYTVRHGILRDLVQRVGETCNLTAPHGDEALYLDRVESSWPLRLTLDAGAQVPMHCTASGKMFLAHQDADSLAQFFDRQRTSGGLQALTPHTLTDQAALTRHLKKIREQGYSLDQEEFITGLVAIAVPVYDQQKQVVAALAMHGPTVRVDRKRCLEMLPLLEKASRRLSQTL
jgi:IclR family acetate operon transcriptional repressor